MRSHRVLTLQQIIYKYMTDVDKILDQPRVMLGSVITPPRLIWLNTASTPRRGVYSHQPIDFLEPFRYLSCLILLYFYAPLIGFQANKRVKISLKYHQSLQALAIESFQRQFLVLNMTSVSISPHSCLHNQRFE